MTVLMVAARRIAGALFDAFADETLAGTVIFATLFGITWGVAHYVYFWPREHPRATPPES